VTKYRDTIPGPTVSVLLLCWAVKENQELRFVNIFRGVSWHAAEENAEVYMPEQPRHSYAPLSGRRNEKKLSRPEYKALAEFRYQIRKYLRYMEEKARARGHHPQQYQLLLAIEGLPDGKTPSIKTLAERMQLNHNSTVELVDRCEKRGLLRRTHDGINRREVTLAATPAGIRMMEDQANASRAELREIGPLLFASLQRLTEEAPPDVLAKVKFNTDGRRRKTMKR
jgi:DNA-binding MarR family transcriptional regulator